MEGGPSPLKNKQRKTFMEENLLSDIFVFYCNKTTLLVILILRQYFRLH